MIFYCAREGVNMPVIIGLNPVRRKKPKRRNKTMAKPKKAKKKATSPATRWRTRTVTKYRSRRAPLKVRRRKSNPGRRDDSLDVRKIVRASLAAGCGMIIAKVAVNKLTEGGSETERWSWQNIFMAAGSALVVAFAGGALLKLKKPTVAYIAIGGVGLAFYKVFTTKIAPRWAFTESWFGADEGVDIDPAFLGDGGIDVLDYEPGYGALPGQGIGETGSGGRVVPFNPNMGATGSGGRTVPFNPNMGETDFGTMSRRIASGYPGSY